MTYRLAFSFQPIRIWVIAVLFLLPAGLLAQDSLKLANKRIGIYFSSKQFAYTDAYNLPIAQYLSVSENRSYSGKMKNEMLIRLGEQLTTQWPELNGADSVYFINGDLTRGRAFINSYDAIDNRIYDPARIFAGTDFIIVLNKLDLTTRIESDVYIHSNRMITERVHVKRATMQVSLFDLTNLTVLPRVITTCLDERKSAVKHSLYDFYRKRSDLGRFLGRLFTASRIQLFDGNDSNCK